MVFGLRIDIMSVRPMPCPQQSYDRIPGRKKFLDRECGHFVYHHKIGHIASGRETVTFGIMDKRKRQSVMSIVNASGRPFEHKSGTLHHP